jgi:hypothetical protein
MGPRLREDDVNFSMLCFAMPCFEMSRQAIFSAPPMYPRSASGTVIEPSAFW